MSTDGEGTQWRRNITKNFNRLSRVHERYRQQTDGRATAYSEREPGACVIQSGVRLASIFFLELKRNRSISVPEISRNSLL